MNRFIMKNAPPLTKKSAQTNTRTAAKNGAAKNRATQLERTTLHEDILSHIKRNLPKPQADGGLKMHSKEERALQFFPGDRKRLRKKQNKLPKGNTENNYDENNLIDDFPSLPYINIPRIKYAQLYVDNVLIFPDEDVQKIFLELNDVIVLIPEISARTYMLTQDRYKKSNGVLVCCPKCKTNTNVKPLGFARHTFRVYDINAVFNAISYEYKCCKCKVNDTTSGSSGSNMLGGSIYTTSKFTSIDVIDTFASISILKRAKCSMTYDLMRKCFVANGPAHLVEEVQRLYNEKRRHKELQLRAFVHRQRIRKKLNNVMDEWKDLGITNFTITIAKEIFKETINACKEDMKAFFLRSKKTWSIHGDGTYKFVLSTGNKNCVLYIITNSYRSILGYFVVPTESSEHLRPAFHFIQRKDPNTKIEAVFMDDDRLFSMLREEFPGVTCLLDIFHVTARILKVMRGDDCDAAKVRVKLNAVFYGEFPSFEACKELYLKHATEEAIAEANNNAVGDVAQVMKSLIRRNNIIGLDTAYDKAKSKTYRQNIRRAPLNKLVMIANMEEFIKFLVGNYEKFKGATNISQNAIKAAKQQLEYIKKGYCSPPESWGNDKLFYKIGERGPKTHLQKWGKVFGTSGVESINVSVSSMAHGISGMNDLTAGNRIAVNLYNQEYERRIVLGANKRTYISVPPREFKHYFLHRHANMLHKDLYGKNKFDIPDLAILKKQRIKFGYDYMKDNFHEQLSRILNRDKDAYISMTDLGLGTNNNNEGKMMMVMKDNNNNDNNNNNNNNNAKKRAAVKNVKHKRKIRRLTNWEAGQDGAKLTKDEEVLVYNKLGLAMMKVQLKQLKKDDIGAWVYKECTVAFLVNDGLPTRQRKNIRGSINIRKIEEICNRKLSVGEPLETTNKGVRISIDELSIDGIKKLTKKNALKLCQFHKISNATSNARMAKNNNSRKLCYIEALCEYKINKKK